MTTTTRYALTLDADAFRHLQAIWWTAKVEAMRAQLARIDPVSAGLRGHPLTLAAIECRTDPLPIGGPMTFLSDDDTPGDGIVLEDLTDAGADDDAALVASRIRAACADESPVDLTLEDVYARAAALPDDDCYAAPCHDLDCTTCRPTDP
jgi:hypothetical protein